MILVSYWLVMSTTRDKPTSNRFSFMYVAHKWTYVKVNCNVHRYHPAYIQSVSRTQWNPLFLLSADPSFLLLFINLMDCESKVNDFPLTTEDALAFTIRHCLQSILWREITASIIGGDTRKTTGTPGGRWLIQIGSFSGGRSERRERRHRFAAFSPENCRRG